jgi:hypothetical protein
MDNIQARYTSISSRELAEMVLQETHSVMCDDRYGKKARISAARWLTKVYETEMLRRKKIYEAELLRRKTSQIGAIK